MDIESQNAEDGDDINEVISIQSEANILQKASEEIQRLTKNNLNEKKATDEAGKNESNKETATVPDSNSILRVRLQNQVRTGEITPFQAAKKETDAKKTSGIDLKRTFKESTQLLDLEKYIWRQVELGKQKKLLKKNKASKNEKEKDEVPTKKRKISESKSAEENKGKTSKKSHSKKIETVTSQTHTASTSKNLKLSSSMDYSIENDTDNIEDNNLMHLDSCGETSNTLMHEQISKVKRTFNLDECEDESGSEYIPSDDYDSEEEEVVKKVGRKKKISIPKENKVRFRRVLDDGDEDIYRDRVEESGYRKKETLHKVDNLFKVPLRIWKKLFKYQKVSVKWLWELHTRNLGGLLGDEMGLGKTVQIIAFLAGLDCSELLSDGGRFRGLGPTLIVCPATLLEQWVQHFHHWCPTFRAVMLHQSGTFQGSVDELLHSLKSGGILVISYTGILIHKESILRFKWHYVILDEGHKIRNPEAKVRIYLKFISSLLTGSPMQNSLKELWSLFDFILPGKLGTLPVFMEHCAGPITRGGYSNATRLQEATALQVATMLKDAITPYMLRRTKYDVQHHVSLRSDDVSYVIHDRREGGRYRARLLVALTALRKICNHPDLFLYTDNNQLESEEEGEMEVDENELDKIGHWKRSGKMTVVRSLLKIWKKQGHRVLLFTQSRQMMHILEGLLQKEKYTYMRMDGTTPMSQRQLSVSKFNKDPSFFVFLLTTRVGGLGVNLTGANRVIIYDPDWNPATDAQARERAWRIGQDKSVTVYRLITAGTIEEKMYHRQVFKILLSNRVLEDPRQRRLFRTTDLTELFNLNEPLNGDSCESDQLFHNSKLLPNQSNFTASKVEAMKKLAAEISKKIGEEAKNDQSNKKQICDKTKPSNVNKKVSNIITTEKSVDSIDVNQSKDASADTIDSVDLNICRTKSDDSVVENVEKNKISNEKNEEQEVTHITKDKPCTELNKSMELENIELKNNRKSETSDQIKIEDGEIPDGSTKNSTSPCIAKNSSNVTKKITKHKKDNKSHKKHKKHKKSKSKNDVSAVFEGERVSCLIGRRLGRPMEPDPVASADDQYVLSKLFSKAAVSSAFQHESVLSNAVLNPDEETPLQRAAKETASEKMDQIRQSRKWCWKPCWDKPPEEDYDFEDSDDVDEDDDNNDGDDDADEDREE